MTLTIGFVFVSLFFVFMLELRKKLGVYAKNFIPLCTIFLWLFIVTPLLVGTPIVIVYLDDSVNSYKYISGSVLGFVSVMLMVGISIGAIVINYVFRQIEAENRANFCIEYLKGELTKVAVRSDAKILRILYEQYLASVENFTEVLAKGLYVNYWSVSENDPDVFHNKVLVTKEEFEQLEQLIKDTDTKEKSVPIEKVEKAMPKKKKQKKLCCSWCYESDDEEKEIAEEEEKIDSSIIRESKDDVVDFGELLRRINGEEEQRNFASGAYVKPFNSISLLNPAEAIEKKEAKIPYEQFLEIIEGSNVDNRKLLKLLVRNDNCRRRYFDQVFRYFAKGSLAEYPYIWMKKMDFISFCKKSEIIDTSSLTESEIAHEIQKFSLLFTSLTQYPNLVG